MSIVSIKSEGDLEVVLLHETHRALAEIISPELYSVGGIPPEQSVLFHTGSCFNLFLILAVEFFAEGRRSAFINQKYQNWSLLKGLSWFCTAHQDEATATGLDVAVANLESWVTREVPFRFWCPEVNTHVEFMLRNDQLISFGANTAKHNLLRLTDLLGKLETLCAYAGYTFSPPGTVGCPNVDDRRGQKSIALSLKLLDRASWERISRAKRDHKRPLCCQSHKPCQQNDHASGNNFGRLPRLVRECVGFQAL
ncbi:MAG: hypothetical protein M0Z70_07990 [Nitrospiraceae bacterium]|nr:hypothetical protein [Nitrospiraceae bacterium]